MVAKGKGEEMKIVIFILLICYCVGCEATPYELWIDDTCSDLDQIVIKKSINYLNSWTKKLSGKAFISIEGTDKVDHKKALTVGSDPEWGRDFVVCFYDDPQMEKWAGLLGHAYQNGDIWLFRYLLSDELFILTVLHELGHYIGMDDIVSSGAVMDPINTGNTFTEADKIEFCSDASCHD